ncbi:DUF1648 domain-containing protein [Streptococcus gordonii]|uniref:DUF1648 domain-containing protein n=1 Tax=Streptococcus gordonii TaxID=1302 RepID=UPI00073C2DD3|nr:DUF1648 domain-containing protein [Streptococcus gordonii]KTF20000.1 hypothetical protein AT460_09030 [Streptococcus gordonii]KXC02589.1 hypothetical protein AWH02_08135 [Streptococcus gordonii]MBZ2150774.1 DUF1648 domain-containing protein [Streptococcus gordonii]QWZ56890.1 DUF1648 domain-containing protein [Streptococcus gordonii]SQF28065.1 integral membrane protein [Streptococcus gordonii]
MKKNSLQELGWALGVTLLPVLYAVWVYQTLPENLAIHFDLSGKGNAFLPKFLVVSAFPIVMMLLEVMIYWTTIAKDILNRTFKHLIRWIIPFSFVSLYLATIYRGLNEEFDIRKIAAMVVALVFIIVGNYLPKKVQENRQPLNRKLAYLFVGIGFLLFIIAIFYL